MQSRSSPDMADRYSRILLWIVRSRRVTANLEARISPSFSTLSDKSTPPGRRSLITSGRKRMYCPLAASMKMKSKGPSSPGRMSAASPSSNVIRSVPNPAKFSLAFAALSASRSIVTIVQGDGQYVSITRAE